MDEKEMAQRLLRCIADSWDAGRWTDSECIELEDFVINKFGLDEGMLP